MTKAIFDPLIERVICTLAGDRPDKWSEVLDGRTEARAWLIGMTSFHFGGEIDRKAVQAFIDEQVDRIRELDAADGSGRKTWTHSRMPQLTTACGVPDDASAVEDVVAMAVVEGTVSEGPDWKIFGADDDCAQGNHDDPDKPPRAEFRVDTSGLENLRVIDVTRTQLMPDGSLSIVTMPADPSDQESWVAIGVKGPRSEPKVSLTKSDLTKLLEQAFADGVGWDHRYDGGADNQLSCVTDILEDVFDELPADDDEEDYSPSSEPVVTLQVEPTGPHFAGVDAMTGEVIFSDSGKPPKCTISIVRENGLLETMDIDPVYVRQSGYIQEMTPTELEHVRQPPGFDFHDMPGDFKPIPGENPEIDYDQLGGWLYEIISSAGVCTYDDARPARPFHHDEVVAPFTDGGTRTEAEHIIAKAIDRGLSRFRDRMKLRMWMCKPSRRRWHSSRTRRCGQRGFPNHPLTDSRLLFAESSVGSRFDVG